MTNQPPDAMAVLTRLRGQLSAEQAKNRRADAEWEPDPEPLINPHNGLAAGLAVALFFVDHHLRELQPGHDGPSVAACKADDAKHWTERRYEEDV
ncbi:hypothetical protein ACQB60_06195 [Actinomycetota bacterium Odt1-20B]